MAMTPDDVLKLIKDKEVKFIDLRFTDTRGKEQHVTVPVKHFGKEKFEEGHAFDGSSIAGWKGIQASDMLLMPDPTSAILDPFYAAPTISVVCTVLDPIGPSGALGELTAGAVGQCHQRLRCGIRPRLAAPPAAAIGNVEQWIVPFRDRRAVLGEEVRGVHQKLPRRRIFRSIARRQVEQRLRQLVLLELGQRHCAMERRDRLDVEMIVAEGMTERRPALHLYRFRVQPRAAAL